MTLAFFLVVVLLALAASFALRKIDNWEHKEVLHKVLQLTERGILRWQTTQNYLTSEIRTRERNVRFVLHWLNEDVPALTAQDLATGDCLYLDMSNDSLALLYTIEKKFGRRFAARKRPNHIVRTPHICDEEVLEILKRLYAQ